MNRIISLGILAFLCLVYSVKAAKIQEAGLSDGQIDSLLKKVELIPIMINGEKDNRINIVLMNRWTASDKEPYNKSSMRDEFIKDINESLIAALTQGDKRAQTAYANYRNFFNVYGLWYPDSPEWNKGINDRMVDALRDRLFFTMERSLHRVGYLLSDAKPRFWWRWCRKEPRKKGRLRFDRREWDRENAA